MGWFARSKLQKLLSPSRARQSTTAALGWRLWVVGLLAVVASEWTGWIEPAVAALLSLTIWTGLGLQANRRLELSAKDPRRSRRYRSFAFMCGLLASVGFLLLAVTSLAVRIDADLRTPIVVLAATFLASAMAWIMLHRWWTAGHMIVGASVVVVAAFVAIWRTVEHPADAGSGWLLWLRSASRLLCVFVAVGVFETLSRRRPWSKRQRKRLVEGGVRTAAFIAVLAGLHRMPEEATGVLDRLLAVVLFLFAVLGTLHTVWKALPEALHDLRWLWSLRRMGWEGSGVPTAPLFVSIAFIPPLLLAPISEWGIWLLSFLMAALAAGLKLANEQWDPWMRSWRKRRATRAASPEPPEPQTDDPSTREPPLVAAPS